MDTAIIGAGGHGQTVVDAMLRATRNGGPMQPTGYLDDTLELQDWQYQGIRVLRPLDRLAEVVCDGVIIAIGDNHARRRIILH